jgi:hypothetical protein
MNLIWNRFPAHMRLLSQLQYTIQKSLRRFLSPLSDSFTILLWNIEYSPILKLNEFQLPNLIRIRSKPLTLRCPL